MRMLACVQPGRLRAPMQSRIISGGFYHVVAQLGPTKFANPDDSMLLCSPLEENFIQFDSELALVDSRRRHVAVVKLNILQP